MKTTAKYLIVPESNLIYTYFTGEIVVSHIKELNDQFIADEQYSPAFDVLMDFTNASVSFFKEDIKNYLAYFKSIIKLPERVKVAFVSELTKKHHIFLSIYQPVAKIYNMDVKGFVAPKDAFNWFQLDETCETKIKQAILKWNQ